MTRRDGELLRNEDGGSRSFLIRRGDSSCRSWRMRESAFPQGRENTDRNILPLLRRTIRPLKQKKKGTVQNKIEIGDLC